MDKKSIHVSKSFAELQQLTEIKMEMSNVKVSCRLLNKLFEEFEKSYLDQDEELAYIYIMRYLTIFSESRKIFKSDKNYIEALHNSKKIDLAFEKADNLKTSLKARYELETIMKKTEEIVQEPVILTNNHRKEFISATDLYKCIKSNEAILIVDGRSAKEFESCHIDYSQIVNIPADELIPGCSIVELNKLLERRNNYHELNIWGKRKSALFVVLLLWAHDSNDDRINILKDAILKFDAEYSIKDLRILEGGLFSFSAHYPTMMTNPKYKGPTQTNHNDDAIAPENIHYPDWDLIESDKIRRKKNSKKIEDEEIMAQEQKYQISEIDKGKDQSNNDPKQQTVSNYSNVIVNRSLKPSIPAFHGSNVADLKSSAMVVDRSLKPSFMRRNMPQNQIAESSSWSPSALTEIEINKRPTTKSAHEQQNSLNDGDQSSISSQSSQGKKTSVLRTLNVENIPAAVAPSPMNNNKKHNLRQKTTTTQEQEEQEQQEPELQPKEENSCHSNVSFYENTRLSNNSRTDQDRHNFTAKGGAKSIPPPPPSFHSTTTNTVVESSEKKDMSQRIFQIYDSNTDEYFFERKNNTKRYQIIPNDESFENSKENTIQSDHIVSLKDHSAINKPILKPPNSASALKRSTSQPNLTEELNSSNKPSISNDNNVTTTAAATTFNLKPIDHMQMIPAPPILDRGNKPSYLAKFTEFNASRLNNFNPSYKTVTPGLTGLRNMGNTCYMNSVIQALSNTKFLSNYILTNSYRQDINRHNPLGYGGEIVTEYAFLIIALWNGNYREVSPSDFKHMIDCKNEMFRGTEQHDSQEFLLFLLDGLHEDLNRGSKHLKITIPPSDENQLQQTDSIRAEHSWKTHVAVNDSVIVRLFQGQYRSKVTCDHCQMSSVTFDAFMYLSLPLVPNHNRCTLEDCLKLFLAEERMTGASQWFCPKCKTNRNAKKKIDIWKLPPYLLIHLKRFSCSGQYREKLNTFVDFPMDLFSLVDILKHTKQSQKHDTYHLYAVSNHHGNMESGHYTSFCKNLKEDEWYNYDDDIVMRIRDVKTPSAYILFYESYNLKQAGFKK